MASPARLYQQEMHQNLGFFATWFPGSPLELGDVGMFEGGQFRRASSLSDMEVPLSAVREGKRQNVSYSASAKRSGTLATDAGLSAGVGQGELTVSFSSEGGFVFEAVGLRCLEVADRSAMADGILQLHHEGRWRREWVVIEALYIADSATVLVSQEQASEIRLKAKANIPSGPLQLADPSLGLTVAASSGRVVHVLAGTDLRPLYSCARLRDPLFGNPSVVPVRGKATDSLQAMARPGLDELLDS